MQQNTLLIPNLKIRGVVKSSSSLNTESMYCEWRD